jgi:signal peptidase II
MYDDAPQSPSSPPAEAETQVAPPAPPPPDAPLTEDAWLAMEPPPLPEPVLWVHGPDTPAPLLASPPSPPSPWSTPPASSLPPPAPAPRSLLIIVAVLSLVADLASKAWVTTHLAGFDLKVRGSKHIDVVKDHFELIFAQNPGGAWSFLRGWPDTVRRPFFLVVSAAAVVFIISIYRRVHADQWAMKWGLPLALGGAIGNLVDRIHYGWVVDFLDVFVIRHGREHHWPTFNVADIAIVLGVGLMAIDMLWLSRRREKAAAASAGPRSSIGAGPSPFMAPPHA